MINDFLLLSPFPILARPFISSEAHPNALHSNAVTISGRGLVHDTEPECFGLLHETQNQQKYPWLIYGNKDHASNALKGWKNRLKCHCQSHRLLFLSLEMCMWGNKFDFPFVEISSAGRVGWMAVERHWMTITTCESIELNTQGIKVLQFKLFLIRPLFHHVLLLRLQTFLSPSFKSRLVF